MIIDSVLDARPRVNVNPLHERKAIASLGFKHLLAGSFHQEGHLCYHRASSLQNETLMRMIYVGEYI